MQSTGVASTDMQPSQQAKEQHFTGRSSLLRLSLLSAAAAPSLLRPPAAAAAELTPLLPARFDAAGPSSALLLESQLLPLPPGPIAFPRRQLDLNFAVLLLRSGYEACDDLDFTPMVSNGRSGMPGCRSGVTSTPGRPECACRRAGVIAAQSVAADTARLRRRICSRRRFGSCGRRSGSRTCFCTRPCASSRSVRTSA